MKAARALLWVTAYLLVAGCQPKRPAASSALGTTDPSLGLTGRAVQPYASFMYGPNLVGEVRSSVLATDVGKTILFSNLNGIDPRATFQGSSVGSPLKVVFDNESEIGLQLNTGSSFDSFVINKTSGIFARTWSGNFGVVYAGSSIGACR